MKAHRHAHTHARAHARTQARTHARAHARTRAAISQAGRFGGCGGGVAVPRRQLCLQGSCAPDRRARLGLCARAHVYAYCAIRGS
eukprot:6180682-Pleurochrysis_carterae.AAC.2